MIPSHLFLLSCLLERIRAYHSARFCVFLRIYVFGQVSTEYISEETPIPSYYSLHLALERSRTLSSEGQTTSPRVLLIGEEESGKTSLMKTLANWAIRSGRARTEREVPAGEMADEGEGKSRGVLLVNLDTSEVRDTLSVGDIVLYEGENGTGSNNNARHINTCTTVHDHSIFYTRLTPWDIALNRYTTITQHTLFSTTTKHCRSRASIDSFVLLVRKHLLGSTFRIG